MISENVHIQHEHNYSVCQFKHISDLDECTFTHERIPLEAKGKLFLSQVLECTGSIISLNTLPPHSEVPFYHRHVNNEEVYVFLRGSGQFEVDKNPIPVKEGTAIKVAPDGVRILRNPSDDDLYFLVIQGPVDTFPHAHTIEDGRAV
ncbi:cupin domain-containing protein [Vibrio salinus]|uniref:cupin domain-containing protein n=1 Tax=Vibrio salinus TaxID=2899784 RepID=UPI001E3505AE|nr:cupin domain-containing protein [Vibrio salinus]MCE0495843.1 cupin domain-containing protein [Vibrio salinus]